ncbi:P-loop containing nucleoside triphosphate hydrolase protein [Lipomyces tetrasporus]|uniref:P-loop containing nucleoside triphosphate hydrolase protein n=1 Tax=Lipomyces tetrasporus TaxID=54092 RepID=A0AAD7QYG0_9ASCO|nr:P-loop containing nucleoside triphosphate hydrolase protein [Lipomyces tetrasporus]KAJ8103745.1 P-loop containing nucleoside triphosphate hydrolase protein [Lipomyces tetrasporus]
MGNEEKDVGVVNTQTTPLLGSEKSSTAIDVPKYADEFSSLPPSEARILREQVLVPDVTSGFFQMFRFATASDKFLYLIAIIAGILEGTAKPLMTLVFGYITQTFTDYYRFDPFNYGMYYNGTYTDMYFNGTYPMFNDTIYNGTETDYGLNRTEGYYENNSEFMQMYISPDEFQRRVNTFALFFLAIGIADMILSYIQMSIFIGRGEVLSSRIRENYLRATLKQNIGYFDKLGSGEITTRISSDTLLIQDAISEKVGFIVSNVTTFFAAFALGFALSYKLTFIMMSVAVFILTTFFISSGKMTKYYKLALGGVSTGGTLAEEVLSSVRNVQAFGIQDRLALKYDKFLTISQKWALRAGIAAGAMSGTMWLGVFANDSLAFWQGSRFLARDELTISSVITILMAMVQGTYAISNISPHVRSITNGMAAASKIFQTIDRVSVIDSSLETGMRPETVRGDIELRDVKFIYPSRPNVTVLDHFSLKIPAGKTVALVGASGSGKSTIVGLLERFYLPLAGQIFLDGVDLNGINIKWLRSKVALVSQEPTLFSCSIFENVAHGLIGTPYENVSPAEKLGMVIEACKQANAMTFIDTLPEGLDTNVGERGFLMSGGQKQRIAIARAIVGNPKILLLDEATSALDTKSEGVVQEALDRASKNRTTIVIAHRLSTIKDADCIVVMRKGAILEVGTHNELLAKQGEYYGLVEAQHIHKQKEEMIGALQKNSYSAGSSSDSDGASSILDEKASLEKSDDTLYGKDTDALLGLSKTKTGKSDSTVALSADSGLEESASSKYGFFETIGFLIKLSGPENHFNIVGAFFSGILGLSYPALGLFYARCIEALRSYPQDTEFMLREIDYFAGLFFMLSVVAFLSSVISLSLFAFAGQKLVRRIRLMTFRQMLRQDISFFDRDENTTGSLTSTLSRDAQAVDGLSGTTLGQLLSSTMIVVSSVTLALIIAWNLGLVTTACVPLLLSAGFYRFYILAQFQRKAQQSSEGTASYACEATAAIRTVAALTREEDVMQHYHADLQREIEKGRVTVHYSALLYGIAQGMVYLIMALTFWYGARFLKVREYDLFQFYVTFMAVVFGSQSAGIMFSFASDMGKAFQASQNIKQLLDLKPQIDTWSDDGDIPQSVRGEVEFKNVHFRYPTRPQVPVLRGLNLSIKPGQYVALVGSSGCGKSTTIGLLESFYSPLAGKIMLDGKDISLFNINEYRKQIALVSQEPTLYAGTIKENIQLGSSEPVTDEQIYIVCKQANIHDFIVSLPDGYDTLCGSKGALLSGGQKQRIAIARALIREPKILLLDEATSALDSESEKVVQAALDAAAKGRTTIAVAHRLSTIQKADVIFVFENGKVLESGTHQELLANKSKYYELVQMQALEATS